MTVLPASAYNAGMDKKTKLIFAAAATILVLGLLFVFVRKDKPGTAPPGGQGTASSAREASEQQKSCESIVSAEAVSDFANHAYEYQEESTGFAGDFTCFYMTQSGPGSRTIDFKIVKDGEKTLFEAAKGVSDNITPAPEFGEAYYLKNSFEGSDLPEWSLHVHRSGNTYVVNAIQHQPEPETKAFMKAIFDKLVQVQL